MNPDIIYNQLGYELKSIEDQIRELKQKQYTGTDTVQTYVNQNETWDIDWTPTWVAPQTQSGRDFSVLFASETQLAPVNNMRYIILIDNSVYYTVNTFNDHPQDCAVLGYVHDSFLSYAGLQPTPQLDGWYFNITAYRSGMNIKVKFIVDSTDTGVVSWKEI
jgi:hypothetical protein